MLTTLSCLDSVQSDMRTLIANRKETELAALVANVFREYRVLDYLLDELEGHCRDAHCPDDCEHD